MSFAAAPFLHPMLGRRAALTTWDPAVKGVNIALSNGNLRATKTTVDGFALVLGTTSRYPGKYYFEITNQGGPGGSGVPGIGVMLASDTSNLNDYIQDGHNSAFVSDGSVVSAAGATQVAAGVWGAWSGAAAVACVAVDFNNRLLWFRKPGGLWNNNGSADPATAIGGFAFGGTANTPGPAFKIALGLYHATTAEIVDLNTGQSPFAGTVPSGFLAWG